MFLVLYIVASKLSGSIYNMYILLLIINKIIKIKVVGHLKCVLFVDVLNRNQGGGSVGDVAIDTLNRKIDPPQN